MRITEWQRTTKPEQTTQQSYHYLGPFHLIATAIKDGPWTAKACSGYVDFPERESTNHATEAEAQRAAENFAVELARELHAAVAVTVMAEQTATETVHEPLHRCAGPSCPGLPWRASEQPHPATCNEPRAQVPAEVRS